MTVGSTVTWTYIVTNTGRVDLTGVAVTDDKVGAICTIGNLAAGAVTTCTKTGTAIAGQYTNIGTVTGTPPTGSNVTASDPDSYYGSQPALTIVKKTNGTDNNTAPGVYVTVGSTVTWTYLVTNTGNVTLTNVTLIDNKIGAVSCPQTMLAPGASMTCTATGTAIAGQYTNIGTVTGTPPVGGTVSANDPDNYFGQQPWAGETATGAGIRYPNTANWFMYTPYTTSKVDFIAGGRYDAGDIHMSRTSTATTITIVLRSGWRWAAVRDNLKIQPYDEAPTSFVEPGSFAYKWTVSGNIVTVTIPGTSAKFYGIHGDVERQIK